jgi:hypothetical protein
MAVVSSESFVAKLDRVVGSPGTNLATYPTGW